MKDKVFFLQTPVFISDQRMFEHFNIRIIRKDEKSRFTFDLLNGPLEKSVILPFKKQEQLKLVKSFVKESDIERALHWYSNPLVHTLSSCSILSLVNYDFGVEVK